MVNVANGSDVTMNFVSLKFSFSHFFNVLLNLHPFHRAFIVLRLFIIIFYFPLIDKPNLRFLRQSAPLSLIHI